MTQSQLALEIAAELGFDLAGLAPLAPAPDAGRYRSWVEQGHHGGLGYLERAQTPIADPGAHFAPARTLLMVGMGHSRAAVDLPGGTRVARYAAGRDYHNVMGKRLRKLSVALRDAGLGGGRGRVDAVPLLERSHAEVAGLGFASKAANLLHPRFGPWFFLGEVLLEWEPEIPERRPFAASCGSCTACIDACPTAAILEPGLVDSPRCISYQTIEHKGQIPHELRPAVGPWAFGCDVCSEVCPWGRKAPELGQRFGLHASLDPDRSPGGSLDWLDPGQDETAFAAHFQGSPLRRPGRAGLARNAAIVAGNRPTEAGERALLLALEQDPDPLVREAAAWGLVHGHSTDQGVLAAVNRAAKRETDPAAAEGIARSLAGS